MNEEELLLLQQQEDGIEPETEATPEPVAQGTPPPFDEAAPSFDPDAPSVEVAPEGEQSAPVVTPPKAPPPPGKMSEDIPLLLAQGATLGGREEIIGGLYGAYEGAKALPQGPGAALKAAKAKYEEVMRAEHQKTQEARARNPYLGTALEMAGGFAAPIPGAGVTAKYGAKGLAALSGVVGGATGALDSPDDRLGGATTGAGIGVAIPAGAKALGGISKLIPGVEGSVTNRATAGAAKILAPSMDEKFYLRMLTNPEERRAAIEARRKYTDIPAAGEQVGELFDDVIGGVRANQGATKVAGNKELIQAGYLEKPMDNAINYVERKLQFLELPENSLNYSAEMRQTMQKTLANLKGYFPEANMASGKVARRDAMKVELDDLKKKLAVAQSSSNKSALMQRRAQKLANEIQQKEATFIPLNDEVDEILVKGYHEARQDLDAIINWDSSSNVPRPSRADQALALETREYIDSVMKTSPSWRAHDEAFAAWAPLEKALKKHIDEAGGTGNVDYKKVWALLSGAGGEGAAANKQRLLTDFGNYVRKHFSGDPDIMAKLEAFEKMSRDLGLAKQMTTMGAATGMSTGRFGSLLTGAIGGGVASGNAAGAGFGALASGAAAVPVTFPTIYLNLLNKAQSAKEFITKLAPYLPPNAKARTIIMVNQALKQKPDLTVEEAATIVQNQVNQGEKQ